jgi:hypothetical protein
MEVLATSRKIQGDLKENNLSFHGDASNASAEKGNLNFHLAASYHLLPFISFLSLIEGFHMGNSSICSGAARSVFESW